MIDPFLGAAHVGLRDEFLNILDRHLDGVPVTGAWIHILEGPTGYGKTRILRELYAELRARFANVEGRDFWPALPAESADSGPLERKTVGPELSDVRQNAKTLPNYGWWSIQCVLAGPTEGATLATIQPQIDATSRALGQARLSHMGLLRKVYEKLGKPLVGGTVGVLQDNVAGVLIDHLPKVAGLGWGPLPGLVTRRLKAEARDIRAYLRGEASGELSEQALYKAASALAGQVVALSGPGLPSVLVVEDLHLMDVSVRKFLEGLTSDPKHPVLVVGTAWPTGHTEQYAEWRRSQSADAVKIHAVGPLDLEDRVRLILSRGQGTIDPVTARQLAGRLQTPLAVRVFMGLGAVRQLTQQARWEQGVMSRLLDLSNNSQDLDALYLAKWQETDPGLREALTLGVSGAAEGDELATHRPDLIVEVIGDQLPERFDDRAALETSFEGTVAARWCQTDGSAHRFTDPHLARIAGRAIPETLGMLFDRGEFATRLSAAVGTELSDEDQVPDAHLARAAAGLGIGTDSVAGVSAVISMSLELIDVGAVNEAADVLVALLGAQTIASPQTVQGLCILMDIVREFGHVSDATTVWRALAEQVNAVGFEALHEELQRKVLQLSFIMRAIYVAAQLPLAGGVKELTAKAQVLGEELNQVGIESEETIAAGVDLFVELETIFARRVHSAGLRGAAVDRLTSMRERMVEVGDLDPGDEYVRALTEEIFALAGGSGKSTVLLPIARSHEEAVARVEGVGSRDWLRAATYTVRWQMKASALDKREALERSFELLGLSEELFGEGAMESMELATVYFRCRASSAEGEANPGDVRSELARYVERVRPAVQASPRLGGYLEWMSGNIVRPESEAPSGDKQFVALELAGAGEEAPVSDVELASSLYRSFLSTMPFSPSGDVRGKGNSTNVFLEHLAEHGLRLEDLTK